MAGFVVEPYLFLNLPAVLSDQLIEVIVNIVDDKGRGPGKVGMRPGICQDMHGQSGCLCAFVFGKRYGIGQKAAVGTADQVIFFFVPRCPSSDL